MSETEPKRKRKGRIGRPPKSGAYSPICRQEFLEEYPEIRRYIQDSRDGLIADQLERIGGKTEDDLTTAQRLMIDRQISKLTVSRQIEVYLKRNGLIRRDQLKRRQILEPEPILIYWLNLQNSLDRGLIALGLEAAKRADEPETLQAYIARTYGPDNSKPAQDGERQGKLEADADARMDGAGQGSNRAAGDEAAREGRGDGGTNERE